MSSPFIIDLDPGFDDLQAILIALRCPTINVVAYTVCSGNIEPHQGSKNLNTFLYFIGERDYHIFKGSSETLTGDKAITDGYFSKFGLCGVELPDAPESYIDEMPAPEAIVNLVHKYSGKISIICMGPLTNLARAYNLDPTISDKFKRIYIMGGARSELVKDNVTQYAEFNSFADPIAVKIVYENIKPRKDNGFIVVDWSFCHKYDINKKIINYILNKEINTTNPKLQFYKKVLCGKHCTHITDSIRYLTADPFIVIAAGYRKAIKQCSYVNFDSVVIDGDQKGRTIFTCTSIDTNITLINKMNMKMVEHKILDSIEMDYSSSESDKY